MTHPAITAYIDAQNALYAAENVLKLAAQRQAELAREVLQTVPDHEQLSEYQFLVNYDWHEITGTDENGDACIEYWTRGCWGGSDEAYSVKSMLDRLSPLVLNDNEEAFKTKFREEVQAARMAMYDRKIAEAQRAADAAQRNLEALRSLRT